MKPTDRPVSDDQSDTHGDTAAPFESAAYAAFIAKARQDGNDANALRHLLWLINGHPQLLGHRRCLQNLHRLLQRPELVETLEGWAEEWQVDARRWLPITQWAVTLKPTRDGALDAFFREPAHERHHVLMHRGIGRHPVAAALWTRHHEDPDPAQAHAALAAASRAFGLLQWHLTCAHAEARARSSTVDQFEHYSGTEEWPAEPIRTDDAARAVRQLSHATYDSLLQALPLQNSTPAYALALITDEAALLELADSVSAAPRVVALLRYFKAFVKMMGGEDAATRLSGGGTGRRSGSRWTIPGFIHFGATPSVFFEPAEADSHDDDVPRRDFVRVHVSAKPLTPQAIAELESQGIAPQENLRPVVDLFPADERPGGMSSLWMRRQALEAAAQRHAFDRRNLTRHETRTLVTLLDECPPPLAGSGTREPAFTEAQLVVRSMFFMGCDLEQARAIRLMPEEQLSESASAATVQASARWIVHDGNGCCVGWAATTVQPIYKSEEAAGFRDCGNKSQHYILLPDTAGLGTKLLRHCRARGREPDGPIFVAEHDALLSQVNGLLASVNRQLDPDSRPRVTLAKVQDKLSSQLFRAGVDETAVALIVGDAAYAGQARLHYTQHPLINLRRAYQKAATRLLREAGVTTACDAPPEPIDLGANVQCASANRTDQTGIAEGSVVGARLIVRPDALREFVARIRDRLERRPAPSLSAWREYHDTFLLYCLAMQGLCTGGRAGSKPGIFLSAAQAADGFHGEGRHPKRALLVASVAEKDDQYQARARAIFIPHKLTLQLRHLVAHDQATWRWAPAVVQPLNTTAVPGPFVSWTPDAGRNKARQVGPAWIAQQLAKNGLQAPANFHRGYLRSRLLQRDCPPQVVDCFLGHANAGEQPHGRHGTFDYGAYAQSIARHIDGICEELGLDPLRSRLAESGQ